MNKIIKHAQAPQKQFEVGQLINWTDSYHDGRSRTHESHSGKVIKVCKVNLHIQDNEGNIWSINKNETMFH